jgi:glycosyltransferase involved in cell wall biosynthesis
MHILLIITKLKHVDGSPWLASELVDELLRQGNSVCVINIEWSGRNITSTDHTNQTGLTYKHILPCASSIPKIGIFLKWFFSSLKAVPFMFGLLCRGKKFDLGINFSPCMATYATHPLLKILTKKSLLIYWDFFPEHNQQILAALPKKMVPFLKFCENKLVRFYDFIGLMSPRAVNFSQSYFELKETQNIFVLPIWTKFLDKPSLSPFAFRREFGFSSDRVLMVFGGQLSPGRGLIELCHAAIDAHNQNSLIMLLVVGDGVLSSEVKSISQSYPDVIRYLGRVNRARYMQILTESDVGLVATVSGVVSPTFPSKCLDYMACELPILASVEEATDFGEIIENNGMGISCLAGNHDALVNALIYFSVNPLKRKEMGKRCNSYLRANHSVESICASIYNL